MKTISKRLVTSFITLLLTAALFCGCIPKNYSENQEKALVDSCTPAIQRFLEDRYGEYEMGEFQLLKGQIDLVNSKLGQYGSNVVRGSYTVNGNTWDLVYDSETGAFYTNELLGKLMEEEADRISGYLAEELPDEDLSSFEITVLDTSFMVMSHNIQINNHGEAADTYVYINYVLPADLTEDDLPEFAARDFDGGIISRVRCKYFSDRKDAITESNFQAFFADNPAYQVNQYLFIENTNPAAE